MPERGPSLADLSSPHGGGALARGTWMRNGLCGISLAALAAAGCAAPGAGAQQPGGFQIRGFSATGPDGKPLPGPTQSEYHVEEVPWSFWPKRSLKNPRKLHTAYAQWQEDLGNLAEARKS